MTKKPKKSAVKGKSAPQNKTKKPFRLPKMPLWIVILVCIIVLGAIVAIAMHGQGKRNITKETDNIPVNIYFLNASKGILEPEERIIKNGSHKDIIENILTELRSGPKSASLSGTIPADSEIKLKLYDNHKLVDVQFSDDYKNMSPNEELFCRASLVWTLTEAVFIDDVHIYVGDEELLKSDGEPIGLLNRNNVKIEPEIPPVMTTGQDFKVFFADGQGLGLIAEECTIQVAPNQQVETYIVEQLIKGPTDPDLFRTIPAETKVRDVKTDDSICYVDLSADFINKFEGGSTPERLAVYSIVNSLTELPGVKKVQILIEGNKVSTIAGHMDLSSPFERNAEIILD